MKGITQAGVALMLSSVALLLYANIVTAALGAANATAANSQVEIINGQIPSGPSIVNND